MVDIDKLGTYNGELEHNLWVDFNHYENTGNPDYFNGSDIATFIDNINDLD